MADCIIHPIPIFEEHYEKSMITYRRGFGERIPIIGYVWYIEGTRDRILVDASGGVEYIKNVLGVSARNIQTMDAGLNKLGIEPGDIDVIIFTHLHFDHVAQAHLFPEAKLLVHGDELEFARNPHPISVKGYPQEFIEGLDFEVVSVDTRISEEVSVLSTPGHSPGGLSVSVKTAQGMAIISGLCTIRENFEPPSPVKEITPVIPTGLYINPFVAYDSLLRIKEMADIVVPLHDPEFLGKSSIP